MSRSLPHFLPFHDEASRRQWESSIGIKHSTPKSSNSFVESYREFTNPLKEGVDSTQLHRPASPLLNIDEDRTIIDEYADVAGCYFNDVLTTKVPSRAGKRGVSKGKPRSSSASKTSEKIYAPPAYLPRLKGMKRSQKGQLNEKAIVTHQRCSKDRSNSHANEENNVNEAPFDQQSIFNVQLSQCLTRFDHSAYAMIPGKLYKYEESMCSHEFKDDSWADMFIPYNVQLEKLKFTIFDIVFGRNALNKKQLKKAMKKLRVWVYQDNRQQWVLLTSESDWSHSKLLAQELSGSLKLMYSLNYVPSTHSDDSTSGSSTVRTSDELTVCTADTGFASSNLKKLATLSPNPPPSVNVETMLILKHDDMVYNRRSMPLDSIPKEKGMADILESRLMKSRY